MRIISGKYKNRNVQVPKGEVRPVMSKMREAFFSIVQNEIINARFLDVFCGSGIMSLEALSRGAKSCDLVDLDKKHKLVLEKNFGFVSEKYFFFFTNALSFLEKHSLEYDFIYLDPPFAYEKKSQLLEIILKNKTLNKDCVILMHLPFKEELSLEGLEKFDSRKYGGSRLDFFRVNQD